MVRERPLVMARIKLASPNVAKSRFAVIASASLIIPITVMLPLLLLGQSWACHETPQRCPPSIPNLNGA